MSAAEPKPQRQPPWETDGDASTVSFGAWLRRQREVRDVNLREISEVTKIGIRYLEALESDRFDILPAPVFVKGFLKEYSRFVGLDTDEVVNSYINFQQDQVEPGEIEDDLRVSSGGTGSWASGVVIGLAGVLVLSAVAFVAFYAERSRSNAKDSAVATAPDATTPGVVPDERPSAAGAVGTPAVGETTALPGTADRSTPDSGGDRASGSVAPPERAPERSTGSRGQIGADGPLRVTVDFTEDCWVEIVLDGRERISELRVQGESLQLGAQSSVRLTLGNPAAVRIEVNGEPFPVEYREGRVARDILIDLETLEGQATGNEERPTP